MRTVRGVYTHVVALGAEVEDVARGDEEEALALAHDDALQPVLRLGDDLDVRVPAEVRADEAAGRRFVVGDEDARRHAVLHGSSMVSRNPPSSRFTSVRRWRSP